MTDGPSRKKTKFKFAKTLIITFAILTSPLVIYVVLFCRLIIQLEIAEHQAIHNFNTEILPVITSHITDPNVRFYFHRFEDVILPQFDINYAPNLIVNFHTSPGWSSNEIIDRSPLLGVSAKNIKTKETCGFVFSKKNYSFLNQKPDYVNNKLLDIYYNRQTIIDDFVAEQPECFLE